MKKPKIKKLTKKQMETMKSLYIEQNTERLAIAISKARVQTAKLSRALLEVWRLTDGSVVEPKKKGAKK